MIEDDESDVEGVTAEVARAIVDRKQAEKRAQVDLAEPEREALIREMLDRPPHSGDEHE